MGWCHITFHSSVIVQSYTIQLNIWINQTTALGVYLVLILNNLVGSSLIGRLKIWTMTWRDPIWDVVRSICICYIEDAKSGFYLTGKKKEKKRYNKHPILIIFVIVISTIEWYVSLLMFGLVLWCLTSLSTIFQLYHHSHLFLVDPEKTTDLSLTNFIT